MQFAQQGFVRIPDWPTFANFVRVEVERPFNSDLLRWEWMTLVLCLLIFTNSFLVSDRWLIAAHRWFKNYASRQTRAIWTCGLFPMVIRVALLPLAPLNPPSVHDEFSLMLLADTLRSGRLTNKPHLFWQHFETIHVIQQPTYQSMYPLGSGVFMAIGMLLGHPWIGVLLSVGCMCAALCWMLQAWLPPAWAMAGALLAALQIGIGSFWVNSYIVPATVPAMAGAFLLGSIPRFLRHPSKHTAVLFAIGVIILINTRPLEGTILSLVCFGVAVLWHRKDVFGRAPFRPQILTRAALVLLAGIAFTGYYDWRVTGNPFRMAYMVNRDTYGWPENLAILPPKKVSFRHTNLEAIYRVEIQHRDAYRTLGRMVNNWLNRAVSLWEFYVGPGLTLALIFLPWVLRTSKLRTILLIALFMLSINTLQLMAYPQHLSPETAIFYLMVAAGLQQLAFVASKKHLLAERLLAAAVVCVACSGMFNLFMEPLGLRPSNFWEWPHWGYFRERAAIASKISSFPGKHLVLVQYEPFHSGHEEWVYNAANIDRSKVVWANSMGEESDNKLRQYFRDRQAWIIRPDRDPNSFLPLTEKTYEQ